MSLSNRIQVVEGDITKMEVDAIVNAANSALAEGSGVNGAILRAAGPELLEACRKLGGCPTGQAKSTPAFNLPARWVIHAVGPIWRGGQQNEDRLLASCYRVSLREASRHGAHTVAFPSISTGVYGFPLERAARIAVTEVKNYLTNHQDLAKVYHVCFSSRDFQCYRQAVEETYA